MLEKDQIMGIPAKQWMDRRKHLAREQSEEHEAAIQRAVALDVPQAYSSSPYGTFDEMEEGETSSSSTRGISMLSFKKIGARWDHFIDRLFDVDESGLLVFKKPIS